MRDATVLLLVKRSKQKKIEKILLAMKKRGFGEGKWNGVGGKVKDGESIEEAAIREACEEISVIASNLAKVAILDFSFPLNPKWDQTVHVYISDIWEGAPTESEEMNPKWFNINEIPFGNMWPDDFHWLPKVLDGNKVKGMFSFLEGDVIDKMEIKCVGFL